MKEKVAEQLKILRNNKGYSAEYVVSELRKYGTSISPVTLYGYENGVSQPKADTFLQICKIYGVTSFDIFFDGVGEEDDNSPYKDLNDVGKAKASEYIEDLKGNPKYTEKTKKAFDDITNEIANSVGKMVIRTK